MLMKKPATAFCLIINRSSSKYSISKNPGEEEVPSALSRNNNDCGNDAPISMGNDTGIPKKLLGIIWKLLKLRPTLVGLLENAFVITFNLIKLPSPRRLGGNNASTRGLRSIMFALSPLLPIIW